jgi:hypothetical protein
LLQTSCMRRAPHLKIMAQSQSQIHLPHDKSILHKPHIHTHTHTHTHVDTHRTWWWTQSRSPSASSWPQLPLCRRPVTVAIRGSRRRGAGAARLCHEGRCRTGPPALTCQCRGQYGARVRECLVVRAHGVGCNIPSLCLESFRAGKAAPHSRHAESCEAQLLCAGPHADVCVCIGRHVCAHW